MQDLELSKFKKEIMNKILKGQDQTLESLRTQYKAAEVIENKNTGVGFFIKFKVAESQALNVKKNFMIDDVYVDSMEGLKLGGGFILYIKNGVLDTLEGYCYDSKWPEKEPSSYNLYYKDKKPRNLEALRKKWM